MTKEEEATLRTFDYLYSCQTKGLCPKCKRYIIIDGYVCFGCGYDSSDE